MKELFVPCELALKLKYKGFNEKCLAYYDEDSYRDLIHTCEDRQEGNFIFDLNFPIVDDIYIRAPLYQQVFSWLLKKLDFNYPYLSLELFYDGSGCWHQTEDNVNDRIHFDFVNLNEAIEKALTLI